MNEEDPTDVFKYIFNTYGPLQSIRKDAELITYFRSMPNQDIRQKTIINDFPRWSKETVRKHLRSLIKRGILEESKEFRGTYRFPPRGRPEYFSDMDNLVEALVGREIYDMAKISWGKKLKNDDNKDFYST